MTDQVLVSNGQYAVTFEPLGRDRLRRRFFVSAASLEEAAETAAERYLIEKRLRGYSAALRRTVADYFDRVPEVGSIASYEDWTTAAYAEANAMTLRIAGNLTTISIETLSEPTFESVDEKNARSDRARQRALEARRRRNERSET